MSHMIIFALMKMIPLSLLLLLSILFFRPRTTEIIVLERHPERAEIR